VYYDYLGAPPGEQFVRSRSLEAPGTHTLAAHTQLDLGAQYAVAWNGLTVEARLDVINVLDHRNPFDWGVRPTDDGPTRTTRTLPGRRVDVGLSVRY
jgi:hypothetical protein